MMFWFLLAAQAGVPGNQGLYCVPYSQYEAPSALRALPSQSPAARTSRALAPYPCRTPIIDLDSRLAAARIGSFSSSSTLSVRREIGPEMQIAPCNVQLMP